IEITASKELKLDTAIIHGAGQIHSSSISNTATFRNLGRVVADVTTSDLVLGADVVLVDSANGTGDPNWESTNSATLRFDRSFNVAGDIEASAQIALNQNGTTSGNVALLPGGQYVIAATRALQYQTKVDAHNRFPTAPGIAAAGTYTY